MGGGIKTPSRLAIVIRISSRYRQAIVCANYVKADFVIQRQINAIARVSLERRYRRNGCQRYQVSNCHKGASSKLVKTAPNKTVKVYFYHLMQRSNR